MNYIASFLGWKIYQVKDGYVARKGTQWIRGVARLGSLKQYIAGLKVKA